MQAINNFPDKYNCKKTDRKCVILQDGSKRAIIAAEKSCPEAQPTGVNRDCSSGCRAQTELMLMENQFVHEGNALLTG